MYSLLHFPFISFLFSFCLTQEVSWAISASSDYILGFVRGGMEQTNTGQWNWRGQQDMRGVKLRCLDLEPHWLHLMREDLRWSRLEDEDPSITLIHTPLPPSWLESLSAMTEAIWCRGLFWHILCSQGINLGYCVGNHAPLESLESFFFPFEKRFIERSWLAYGPAAATLMQGGRTCLHSWDDRGQGWKNLEWTSLYLNQIKHYVFVSSLKYPFLWWSMCL